ncbi:DNA binding protein [Quillaja saponaria]|uniref:DNA binding protein n=1 Tax=Quillaja saponaria TaxID=32244 RepID=A0AAD7P5Y7_QUISA|nr:DNA binding protein [Quillaja saponaria]
MTKPKVAERPKVEEKTDDLEIIAIGSLYKGPWDKKYWSSSRGKERYPYPVGYQAVRSHNGITYKMQIREGDKGPQFVITSADGQSFSAQTPDIAWEEFQKKGCTRIKIWHGKRSLCKIDGVEFFGFKNLFVQRLLRELVADINGTAEQSFASSNFCNEVSRTEYGNCSGDSGTYPDLLLYVERPRITGKRSWRYEIKNVKSCRGALLKRSRLHAQAVTTGALMTQTKENHNEGVTVPLPTSQEEYEVCQHKTISPAASELEVSDGEGHFSSKNNLALTSIDFSYHHSGKADPPHVTRELVDSRNCKSTEVADNIFMEEKLVRLDRSQDIDVKAVRSLVAKEDSTEVAPVFEEFEGASGIDLCVPDTLDLTQGLVTATHPEEELGTSNSNLTSEKSDFDSVGQETAKSMMTFLLPQAIPLLKKVPRKKDFTINPSETLLCALKSQEGYDKTEDFVDAPTSDMVVTENAHMERGENMHIQGADLSLVLPSVEHSKSVILDSLETNQNRDHVTDQEILSSDIAEADRASFEEEKCSPKCPVQLFSGDMQNESSVIHFKKDGCNDNMDLRNEWSQDGDFCISEWVQGHVPSRNTVNSESSECASTQLVGNLAPVNFDCIEKDPKTANDFTGDKLQEGAVVNTGVTKSAKNRFVQVPKLVYTRKKVRNSDSLTGKHNVLLSESTVCRKFGESSITETNDARGTSAALENIQMNSSDDKLCEIDLFDADGGLGGQSSAMAKDHLMLNCTNPQILLNISVPTISLKESIVRASNGKHGWHPDFSVSHVETSRAHTDMKVWQKNLMEFNSSISHQKTNFCDNTLSGENEVRSSSEVKPRNKEFSYNLKGVVKLVGCYLHPMPVSSLFLRTRRNELLVFALCGLLVGKDRTLFIYSVAIREPSVGFPSLMGHTSILLPTLKHKFGREIPVERSGLQFTPDGQCLVLLGSIKTPNCKEGKICCFCPICTSVFSEENVVKIVQVERGYVSVVTKLKTVETVQCILVCEPNKVVSVGESGSLQVWVMNSTWSEVIEEFIIPATDSISPGIMELKRIPKCTHLVVGYDGFGEFSLWDISKRFCVSSFSTSTNSIHEFSPISLFHWQAESLGFSHASLKEHAEKIIEASNIWFSEHREACSFLPSDRRDIAVWLFVCITSDLESQHNHMSIDCQPDPARSWRLALLVKNIMILGSPLDPRAATIGASAGHGIIGTRDGVVYIWELSTGAQLGTLHHFKGGSVSCIATDDSSVGALAVAGDGGQLLVYLHPNETG